MKKLKHLFVTSLLLISLPVSDTMPVYAQDNPSMEAVADQLEAIQQIDLSAAYEVKLVNKDGQNTDLLGNIDGIYQTAPVVALDSFHSYRLNDGEEQLMEEIVYDGVIYTAQADQVQAVRLEPVTKLITDAQVDKQQMTRSDLNQLLNDYFVMETSETGFLLKAREDMDLQQFYQDLQAYYDLESYQQVLVSDLLRQLSNMGLTLDDLNQAVLEDLVYELPRYLQLDLENNQYTLQGFGFSLQVDAGDLSELIRSLNIESSDNQLESLEIRFEAEVHSTDFSREVVVPEAFITDSVDSIRDFPLVVAKQEASSRANTESRREIASMGQRSNSLDAIRPGASTSNRSGNRASETSEKTEDSASTSSDSWSASLDVIPSQLHGSWYNDQSGETINFTSNRLEYPEQGFSYPITKVLYNEPNWPADTYILLWDVDLFIKETGREVPGPQALQVKYNANSDSIQFNGYTWYRPGSQQSALEQIDETYYGVALPYELQGLWTDPSGISVITISASEVLLHDNPDGLPYAITGYRVFTYGDRFAYDLYWDVDLYTQQTGQPLSEYQSSPLRVYYDPALGNVTLW